MTSETHDVWFFLLLFFLTTRPEPPLLKDNEALGVQLVCLFVSRPVESESHLKYLSLTVPTSHRFRSNNTLVQRGVVC